MNSPTRICISGAMGATAQSVIEHLVNSEQDIEIVAGVHDANTLNESARNTLNKHCHEIVSLNAKSKSGLAGVDVMLLIPPTSKNRVQEVKALVSAAKAGGVKFVLLLSILGADTHSNAMSRQFSFCEKAVEESDIPCSVLRTNFYFENILFQGNQLAQGKIALPVRQAKLNWIALEDVGQALAVMLLDTMKFKGKVFDLTGRQAMSGSEFAKHLSAVLGRQIRFESCSQDEYIEMLVDANVPFWLAQSMSAFLASSERNREIESLNTIDFFKDLTDNKPIKFENWLEGHLDTLNTLIEAHGQQQQKGRGVYGDQHGHRTRDSDASDTTRNNEQRTDLSHSSGMRRQSDSQQDSNVSLTELRSILQELILERQAFMLKEKDAIRTNEERLEYLLKLNKRVQELIVGKGQHDSKAGSVQQRQSRGDQGALGQFGRSFGNTLRSDIVIVEFEE